MVTQRWECFTLPGVLEGRDVREGGKARFYGDKSRGGEGQLRSADLYELYFSHKVRGSHLLQVGNRLEDLRECYIFLAAFSIGKVVVFVPSESSIISRP